MNDDEMLTALRSSLTGVKDSFADVRLDRPASAITARARGRRLRRGLSGAGAGALALGVGLGLALSPGAAGAKSVHVNLDAWSINTSSDGLVYVAVRLTSDPAMFRKVLADAGVPAIVIFGKECSPTHPQALPRMSRPVIWDWKRGDVFHGFIIDPTAIPAGVELAFSARQLGKQEWAGSMFMIKDGAALTCLT
jgi:hypothetical protein